MSPPYMCPVCGFVGLEDVPRDSTGWTSFEFCPCCDFEFGVTDDDEGYSYEQWRQMWIHAGMPWRDDDPPPKGWDPVRQLQAVQDS